MTLKIANNFSSARLWTISF